MTTLKETLARVVNGLSKDPVAKRILANVGWLMFDRLFRMGLGVVVGVWVARHLGPEQFGQFNYAAAFVGIFGAAASMGLNSIVVRDLVKNPELANATLGSAFALQIIGGLTVIPLMLVTLSIIRPDDNTQKVLIAIMGCTLVFKATEVVKCWFDSLVLSRLTVIGENIVFLLISIIKVTLIALNAPLAAFAWLFLIEAILTGLALMYVYSRRVQMATNWRPSFTRMTSLLKDSWPLFLSGLSVIVYMRIDQVMLGEMSGNEAVGIYSAATRISEVWYFIPSVIVSSLYPSIVEARKQGIHQYHAQLQRIFSLVVWIALSISVPATFLSAPLTQLIYGDAYQGAGPVLAIHIWAAPFVFLGVASNTWFITENLQLLALTRTLLGAAVNVLANYILIPNHGAIGAAIGTLIAQAVAAYGFDAINPKTRIIFALKSSAFLFIRYKTTREEQ